MSDKPNSVLTAKQIRAAVDCPECSAIKGSYCTSLGDRPYTMYKVHVARVQAAEKALGAEPVAKPNAARDAERWQAIEPYLTVARNEPGAWTCWLELACVPFRSQSTNPAEIADEFVKRLKEVKRGKAD